MNKAKEYFYSIYNSIPFGWTILLLVCIEVVSFSASQFEAVNIAAFIALVVVTFAYSLKRLQYGVYIVFAELFISSKGYLFSMEISSFTVSIRLALFLTVFLAFLIWVLRERKIFFFQWPFWKPYLAVVALIGVGVLVGLARGNDLSTIFFDANGYLYLGLVGPVTQSFRSSLQVKQALAVLFAAVLALSIKTLVILGLFSQIQALQYTLPEVYSWIRDTGVGEITRFENGFSRVFFQSQVFHIITFFMLLSWLSFSQFNRACFRSRSIQLSAILLALSLLVIFLSYSRSFWVGVAGAGLVFFAWLLVRERFGFRRLAMIGAIILAVCIVDYAVAFGIVNIPIPGNVGVSAGELLTERTQDLATEPAAATRWQSLDPLTQAAMRHPLLGAGLGATITYRSEDPRVLEEHPDGMYTTYAFEWGYLDMLLEFGLVGILVFGILVVRIYSYGLEVIRTTPERKVETVGLLSALTALCVLNVFTPYLNHPLGIGALVLLSVTLTTNE